MFGPNSHLRAEIEVRESHRDESAKRLIGRLRESLVQKFELDGFELIFLLGGGSLGVEALLYSSRLPVKVLGAEGAFTSRWQNIAKIHNATKIENEHAESLGLYCQIETSISEHQYFSQAAVDAVSSFPYLPIPAGAPAFVTSSNKLLGSMVGLSIVGISHQIQESLILPETDSYLSLARYFRYMKENQTPSTTSIHNIRHLLEVIEGYDVQRMRQRVDYVSNILVKTIGAHNVIGANHGPVITVKEVSVPRAMADQWQLYRKPTRGGVIQFFTYSCAVEDYERFCQDYARRS